MFGHLPELFIVLLIALVVFGPEKLPEVAANAGKMVREVREIVNDAMNPIEDEPPDDFSTYYQEAMARSGEEIAPVDDELEIEFEPDMVEPEPEPVEPELELVEPEPELVEPQSQMLEPEPEVAEASTEVSEPGESPTENLSSEAEARTEGEPTVNDSEVPRLT